MLRRHLNDKSQKSKQHKLDHSREIAVVLGLIVLGFVFLIVAYHFEKLPKFWVEILAIVGKAFLVGAVIEFIFSVALVNRIIYRIVRSQRRALRHINNQTNALIDSTETLIRTVQSDRGSPIEAVEEPLNHEGFLEDIERIPSADNGEVFDIAVLQSHTFADEHFMAIIRSAYHKSGSRRRLCFLIAHPESASAIDRYVEIHRGSTRPDACSALNVGLRSFLNAIIQDPIAFAAARDGLLAIKLYSNRVSMSVYKCGSVYRIGWFPRTLWCINSPHVRCRYDPVQKRLKARDSLGSMALNQFKTLWSESMHQVQFSDHGYIVPPLASPNPIVVPSKETTAVPENP